MKRGRRKNQRLYTVIRIALCLPFSFKIDPTISLLLYYTIASTLLYPMSNMFSWVLQSTIFPSFTPIPHSPPYTPLSWPLLSPHLPSLSAISLPCQSQHQRQLPGLPTQLPPKASHATSLVSSPPRSPGSPSLNAPGSTTLLACGSRSVQDALPLQIWIEYFIFPLAISATWTKRRREGVMAGGHQQRLRQGLLRFGCTNQA